MNAREYIEISRKYDKQTPEEKEQVCQYNKDLIAEYPFLRPRNVWTGKLDEDYDYTWTLMDNMPDGWRIAFGDDLLRELKEELVKANYLDDYMITQIKEKWGGLRWYDYGCTEKWFREILPKYEKLSQVTCIDCGEPAIWISTGWISPYCDKCAHERFEVQNKRFSKEYKFSDFYNPVKEKESDTVETDHFRVKSDGGMLSFEPKTVIDKYDTGEKCLEDRR